MALLLTRDDQISQDLIDEHDRFSPSSSRCIQFEIQAALIPDQNKFEYQTAQKLVKTMQGFLRSRSAQEHTVYFRGITYAEVEVIERKLRSAKIMHTVRLTFEKSLNAAILWIRPGSAHHQIASTFGYEFSEKMDEIPGHSEYSIGCFGSTIFRIPGVRSKGGDQSFRPRTRTGEAAWPSVMVEVGYPEGMKFLRLDAEWWLLNSQDETRFVILITRERDPFALHIECWMMVETGSRRTRHTPNRIPSCVQDFDINSAGHVTSRTGSTKLEIPYDAVFDVRDPVSPPPETSSFSFDELSGFAVRLFEDLT